ncbi:MAG: thioredoxin domain-containing protein [Polyangiaceae bacterium]
MEALSEGSVFADAYVVVGPRPSGGVGLDAELTASYEVRSRADGERAELVLLKPPHGENAVVKDAWLAEAKRAMTVRSPHVVTIRDAGFDPASGLPWMVREDVSGPTLAEHLERRGSADRHLALEIVRQICVGLAAAHAANVIVADLEPQRIVLVPTDAPGARFVVKLSLLGAGRLVSTALRNTTAAMSRPLWMAPEQTETDSTITPATDTFTVALLAFWLLTGRHYWRAARDAGSAMMGLMREVLFEPVAAPTARVRELGLEVVLPAAFDAWFAQGAARSAERRFTSAEALYRALAPILEATEAHGAPPAPANPLPPKPNPASVAKPEPPKPQPPPEKPAPEKPAPEKPAPRSWGPTGDFVGAEKHPPARARKRRRTSRPLPVKRIAIVAGSALLVAGVIGAGVAVWRTTVANKAQAAENARALSAERAREVERRTEREERLAKERWQDENCPIPISYLDPMWGDRAAPITIVEFAPYPCADCGPAHATLARLKKDLGKSRLRVVRKLLGVAGESGDGAAAIAEAVFKLKGSAAVFDLEDKILNVRSWADASETVRGLAATAVGGESKLDEALKKPAIATKLNANRKLAEELGALEVPAFFVNGVRLPMTTAAFRLQGLLKSQLDAAKAERDRGTPAEEVYVSLTKAQYAPRPAAPEPFEAIDSDTRWKIDISGAPVRGPADALVTIVVFGDHQSRASIEVDSRIKQYMSFTSARLVWRDRKLADSDDARAATLFAREVRAQKGDDGFWSAHDKLAEQSWGSSRADLMRIAEDLSVNGDAVNAAIDSAEKRAALVAEDAVADDLGCARNAPEMFVNGKRVPYAKLDTDFYTIVHDEETKARAIVDGGVQAAKVYDELMKSAVEAKFSARRLTPIPIPLDAPRRGPADAPFVVQEFCDLDLPACADFEEEAASAIADLGVALVWRHLPSEKSARPFELAITALEVRAQLNDAAFFAFVGKALADTKPTYGAPNGTSPQVLALSAAPEVKLEQLEKALAEGKRAELVERDLQAAATAGIQRVPSFVVGPWLLESRPSKSALRRLIDKAKAEP